MNPRSKSLLASSYSPVKLIARPAPLSASSNEFLQIYPHAEYSPNGLQDSKIIKTFPLDLAMKNDDLSRKIMEKTHEIEFWKMKYEESLKSLPVTEKKLMLLIEENEYLKKNSQIQKNFNQEDLTEKIMKLEEGIQMVLSENDKLNLQIRGYEPLNKETLENENKTLMLQQENSRLLKLINEKDEEIFGLLEQKIILKEKGLEENEILQYKLIDKDKEMERMNEKLLENSEKFTEILTEKSKMIEDLQEKQSKDFEIQQGLQEKLVILLEENSKLNRVCEENNRNVGIFREKINGFTKERLDYEAFKQDLLQAKSLIHEKDQKIMALNGLNVEIKQESEEIKGQIINKDQRIREKDEEIRIKEGIIKQKDEEIKGIEQELIEIEGEIERKDLIIKRKEDDLKVVMNERNKEIGLKNQEINDLNENFKRIKEKTHENEEKSIRLEKELRVSSKELEKYKGFNEELEKTLQEITQNQRDLEEEYQGIIRKNEDLMRELEEKEGNHEKLKEKNEDLLRKIVFLLEINEKFQDLLPEVLTKVNADHEIEKNDFLDKIEKKDEKIETLSHDLETLLSENKKLIEKYEENSALLELYQRKCNDLLEKVKIFMLENDEKLEKSKLEVENKALKHKILELTEEIMQKADFQENPRKRLDFSEENPYEKLEILKENQQKVFPDLSSRNNYGEINDYILKLRESLQTMKKGRDYQKNKKNIREIREMFENVQEVKKGLVEAFQTGGKDVMRIYEEINGRIGRLEEIGKENEEKGMEG